MTSPGSGADGLRPRIGGDGSFSLWSEAFGEGFHGPMGALREARAKFVHPAQLERFQPGQLLTVVDVGFGLGTNSAALLEAAAARDLSLRIWGLEIDPQPLRHALAAEPFRQQWQPAALAMLAALLTKGCWRSGSQGPASTALLLWGDARSGVGELLERHQLAGGCDLVLLDAFSPQRCPQLWTVEFLGVLAQLLKPDGRLLTYCCAAAVRRCLQEAGLHLASIAGPPPAWSFGTVASPAPLPLEGGGRGPLQPLTAMEIEHLGTRAAEPYRDPGGQNDAGAILAARRGAQEASRAGSTSAWRRRWRLDGQDQGPPDPVDQPA